MIESAVFIIRSFGATLSVILGIRIPLGEGYIYFYDVVLFIFIIFMFIRFMRMFKEKKE